MDEKVQQTVQQTSTPDSNHSTERSSQSNAVDVSNTLGHTGRHLVYVVSPEIQIWGEQMQLIKRRGIPTSTQSF